MRRDSRAVRPADEFDELRAVLSAGRPGRFKLLTVVCPGNHALVRVYSTRTGPIAVFEQLPEEREDEVEPTGEGGTRIRSRRRGQHKRDRSAAALTGLGTYAADPVAPDKECAWWPVLVAECECGVREVAFPVLRKAITLGRKRILVRSKYSEDDTVAAMWQT